MQYRTFSDLSALIRRSLYRVPHDIDIVVGIPRSGMIPAYMIALYLNKRVTDIDSFLLGNVGGTGERGQYISNTPIKKVLVIDDSVYSGGSITKAKERLTQVSFQYEFIFMSPFVTTKGIEYVDLYLEIIDDARVFEWNVFHHSMLSHAALDIDGVLNLDPEIDDDGPIYSHFLDTAKPLFVPTVKVNTLITCRLEKYRKQTEEWLKLHNVQYDQLIMLNLPSKIERLRWGKHGEFKADYYKQNGGLYLFIESSKSQAMTIAEQSGKPTLCIETNELLCINKRPFQKRVNHWIKRKFPRVSSLLSPIYQRMSKFQRNFPRI